jgi:hypothetical protein
MLMIVNEEADLHFGACVEDCSKLSSYLGELFAM